MENNNEYDYIFKIMLIGNLTGKTAFLKRFIENIWIDSDSYRPTIGVDFISNILISQLLLFQGLKTIKLNGKIIKLQIWDTAGPERFRNIISSFYRGTNGIIVFYDITDRYSFEYLNIWIKEIEENGKKNACKLLVGNKCDLEEKRKVTFQEGKKFANKNEMLFIEASSKENINVEEAFYLLTEEMINKNKNNRIRKNYKLSSDLLYLNKYINY